MDRHVLWLRRKILTRILRDSLLTVVFVAGLVGTFLALRTDLSLLLSIVTGAVVGQVVALLRIVHASFRNPLNRSFLERFVNSHYDFIEIPLDAVVHEVDPKTGADIVPVEMTRPHPNGDDLPGFSYAMTLSDPQATPAPVFDLYRDEAGVVQVVISRASGAVEFLTQVDDGRILHSHKLVIPPYFGMILNRVTSSAPSIIESSHREALAELASRGVSPVAGSAGTVIEALAREHQAYVELGPFLGPFLSVDQPSWNPLPLLVRPSADDVLALGMQSPSSKNTSPPIGASVAGELPIDWETHVEAVIPEESLTSEAPILTATPVPENEIVAAPDLPPSIVITPESAPVAQPANPFSMPFSHEPYPTLAAAVEQPIPDSAPAEHYQISGVSRIETQVPRMPVPERGGAPTVTRRRTAGNSAVAAQ